MTRWQEYTLIILLGVGIGLAVPYVIYGPMVQVRGQEALALPAEVLAQEAGALAGETENGWPGALAGEIENGWPGALAEEAEKGRPEAEGYHFAIDDDILSVVEGDRVVFAGLEVQGWSPALRALAMGVEFESLDEVQSFIDTVSEPEWVSPSVNEPDNSD